MQTITIDSSNPLVYYHRVQQRYTLPGLAYIDLIYRALYEKGEDIFKYVLQEVTILNPLQLTEENSWELTIQITSIQNGFSFEITGKHDLQTSNEILLLKAKAIKKQIKATNTFNHLDLPAKNASRALKTIYQHYQKLDLEHLDYMRAEGILNTHASKWISKVRLSNLNRESSDMFLFHPILLDGAAVSLAFGIKETLQATDMVLLPIYFEEVSVFNLIQKECYAIVDKDSVSFSGELLKFSIDFYDTDGNLLAQLKNFGAKRLRNNTNVTQAIPTIPSSRNQSISNAVKSETYLRSLFERKSKIPSHQIQREAGFYEWGLSSSELMSIVQELEQKIGTDLSPTLLFEYTTLASLATYLQETYPTVFGIEEEVPNLSKVKQVEQEPVRVIKEHVSTDRSTGDIAIIGLAGRYPQADNLEEFWENLTKGVDAVSTVPPSRWNWKDFEGLQTPSGKPISKWGGFINDVASFDAPFFKVSPKEAETLDPQERWFLQTCWEAMEDAGYTPDTLVEPIGKNKLRKVGVFAGVMHKDYGILGWEQLQKEQAALSLNYAPIPNRVSYFCNFHGPSMAVDTVCSSSLTAIHLAMQSLQNKECKVALAGGVNLSLHPAKYISYGLSNFHATDGRCRAFGSGGDGYVSSEGVGVAVLKPLEDAIRDQDQIYAVLKGSSINHVGKVSGITVPGPIAQQELIADCYEKCQVHPEQISYIEAHGTGTALGDPIEVEGLTKAFRQKTEKKQYCAIGSLKSSIGHAEAAAGIAALSKVALQLHHKKQVPSLHASDENPYLKLQQTPFYVQKRFEDWKQESGMRTAGISSFGATGTNVHLVIQEYIPDQKLLVYQNSNFPKTAIIPLSAKNKKQLIAYADRLLKQLKNRKLEYVSERISPSLSGNTIDPDFQKAIEQKLAEVLRIASSNLSPDTEWQEFGLDTYQYKELQSWLDMTYAWKPELSELESVTIQSLGQRLFETIPNKVESDQENTNQYYLQQIAYTFQTGRVPLEERAVFLVSSIESLIAKLELFVQNGKTGADYQANKTDHEQLLTSFASDEDFDLLIRNWLHKGKSNQIAEIWTKGYPINWSELYRSSGIPGKTKIPTYPFSKKEYWLPIPTAISKKQTQAKIKGYQMTPLVHQNESGFGQTRYSSSFHGEEFFFTDHKVAHIPVLPGVAHIEAVYQSFNHAIGQSSGVEITVSNIHFMRPVVLKGTSCNMVVDLKKEAKNYSYAIYQHDGSDILMSQGTIEISTNKLSHQLQLESYYDSKVYECTDGALIYKQFDCMGIQYGKAHQCIVRAFHNFEEVAVQLSLDSAFHDTLSYYQLHPGLVDAALQATLLLENTIDGQPAWKSLTKAKMPFSIGKFSIIKPCTGTMWAVAQLQKQTANGDTVSNIRLYDDALEIVAIIEDFVTKEVTDQLSVSSSMDSSNVEKEAEIVHVLPSWEVVDTKPIHNRSSVSSQSRYLCINCPEEMKDTLRSQTDEVIFTTTWEILDTDFEMLSRKQKTFDHIFWWISSHQKSLQEAQEEGVYFGYKLLQNCIANQYESTELYWTVITSQSCPIDGYPVFEPTHAGIEGLMGSAIKEYYKWQMRLIDQSKDSTASWEQLDQIPFDKEGRIWAIRDGEWYRQVLTPVRKPLETYSVPTYRTQGTYVLIGGAGNIGSLWSKYLISHFDAKVIWIGRSNHSESIQQKIQKVRTGNNQPDYYQADVTQEDAVQAVFQKIKESYGAIHGVINAAMVLEEQALEEVTEIAFRKGYETKQKSICNLIAELQNEPLDFLLLFSSMVSFIKTPRLSYYAAGNTFMDAYAKAVQKKCAFPIKTVNWGYWQGEQLEEARDFEKLQALGIQPIQASEGIEALNLLLQTAISQVGVMKFSKPLDFSGYRKNIVYKHTSSTLQPEYDLELVTKSYTTSETITELQLRSAYEDETFIRLIGQLAYLQLESIDVLNTENADDQLTRWGTPEYFKDWIKQCLTFFVNQQENNKVDRDTLWKSWNAYIEKEKENPDKKFHINLVHATLKALPEILKNKVRPTDILFPNSSMDKVVNIYKNNKISDYYNTVLSACAVSYIQSRLAQDPNRKIRILEVGAGTGGTSALLFEKLKPFTEAMQEYCYTDISQAFLNFAESTYATGKPYLTFKKFNAEDSIQQQQLEAGVYDIVLGTNVLHATSNIRTSLQHCQSLLKPGGLFLLNEMSKNMLFTHLTFGLLEGWWLPTDKETRIPGCPGLAPWQWEKVLLQSGYHHIEFPVASTHHLGQQVICALAKEVREEEVIKTVVPKQQQVDRVIQPLTSKNKDTGYENQMTTYLRKVVSTVLKLPLEEVSEKESFENYGIDSILIVQLTNELRKDFDAIPGTLFFEHQNLHSMVSYFMSEHQDAVNAFFENHEGANDSIAMPVLEKEVSNQEFTETFSKQPESEISKEEEEVSKTHLEEIAVIGLAGKYPEANTIQEYWDNLKSARNCITEIPSDRWEWQQYFGKKHEVENGSYSRWGGFMKGIDEFDPLFFKISPLEAEKMDPQERLFLQIAYSAIEDAGYQPKDLSPAKRVGVFAGVMNSTYNRQSNHWSISNRVSYALDFQGPSLTVDTACSSSLMAIYLAVESIQSGQCDCAIAGGVNVIATPGHYNRLAGANMLSQGESNNTFGAGADGFVDAEGVGTLLLKPKSKALADGDVIYGIIKGGSTNSGGRTTGYTVPNPIAQADLIKTALERTKINPETISYVEAHGTGTSLGDPIEIAGLTKAYRNYTNRKQFCSIGSSKSNIGHCESAAGIGGLTKILLQFVHKQRVPSLHCDPLNPEIDFAGSPFYIQKRTEFWEQPTIWQEGVEKTYPRRAAISSFGAGGTNVHLILEEAGFSVKSKTSPKRELIVISGATEEQLQETVQNLLSFLQRGTESIALASVAYTLQIGRKELEHRLAFVANDIPDMVTLLSTYLENPTIQGFYTGTVWDTRLSKEGKSDQIQSWFRNHEWEQIASEWVSGMHIPWHSLYDHIPGRISLPTYPFAKESYWSPEPEYDPKSGFEKELKQEERTLPIPNTVSSITLPEPASYFVERFELMPVQLETLTTAVTDLIITGKEEKGADQFLGRRVFLEDFHTQYDWNSILEEFSGSKIVWIQPEQHTMPLDVRYKEETYQSLQALFRFAKACIEVGLRNRVIEWTLFTRRGHQLTTESSVVAPAQASIGALAIVIGKELTKWKVRLIDSLELQSNIPVWSATNFEPQQWIMRNQQVYAKKLIHYQGEQTFNSVYKLRGRYLIAGGAGGVGMAVSEYLIKNYKASIIWVGRRPLDAGIQSRMKALDPAEKNLAYYQADISEYADFSRTYKQIQQDHGAVNGVIHAAMASTDEEISLLNEARFEKGLRAKIDGSLTLGKVFEKESLDFMIFFSSIGALGAMEGQSCYVASSRFKDGFSHYLNQQVKYPVKVVNWGYWGAVGFGAFIPEKLQTLLREQTGVLKPEVANQQLEAFMATSHSQAVITAKANFETLIPMDQGIELFSNSSSYSSIVQKLKNHLPDRHNAVVAFRSSEHFGIKEMEPLLATWMLAQLRSIGILTDFQNRIEEQKQNAGFNRFYDKWLEESLRVLKKNKLIAFQDPHSIQVLAKPEELRIENITTDWSNQKGNWEIDTYKKAQVKLLESSMKHLPKVLTGKMKGAEVVFPDSSMELVEGIYKNELGDYFNDVLTDNILAFIKERIKQDPNARIRLLEVGAGIGGTSSVIFERIRPYEAYIETYCYTDISKAFLHYAEEEYGPQNPYLTYSLFNVGVPAPQDQIKEKYDIVLATNVLHATDDIRNTLVNVKSVLRKNGVLLINEISTKSLFFHMGFALLDGWWLYKDPELRIEGCPGLAPDTWNRILLEHGFESIVFPASEAHDLGQQIIVAQSDGVILRKATPFRSLQLTNKTEREDVPVDIDQISTRETIADQIQTIFSEVLRVPKEKIRSNVSFLDYGLDSIIAVKLVKTIQDVLRLPIESTHVFEYDTMDTLLSYLQSVSPERVIGSSNAGIKKEEKTSTEKTSTYDILKNIIHETLKVPKEKIRENQSLYDYGLDSILAVDVTKKINTLLDVQIDTTTLLENNTISELIRLLQPVALSDTKMENKPKDSPPKQPNIEAEQGAYKDAQVLKVLEDAKTENFSITQILERID